MTQLKISLDVACSSPNVSLFYLACNELSGKIEVACEMLHIVEIINSKNCGISYFMNDIYTFYDVLLIFFLM